MRTSLVALAVTAALTFAAPAGAATLSTDKACYTEKEPVTLNGTGFTPSTAVGVFRDNALQGSLMSDPGGVIGGILGAPTITPTREQRFNLTVVDGANTANRGVVTPLVTQLDVVVKPSGGSPTRKRRITARGFAQGKILRAHVRRKGKTRNLKVGKLRGACGKLKKRKRLFTRRAKTGTYTVQFDTKKRYRKSTKPRVTFKVFVFRRVRASSAGAASVGERWLRVD